MGIAQGYANYEEVLSDPRVNAVVIVTPLRTHYALVREALATGKHVLCEKPLCETSVQVQELVQQGGHPAISRSGERQLMMRRIEQKDVERLRGKPAQDRQKHAGKS
jgi:hypothetical protein